MKKYVMLTLKKALRTYLMIFPFAIIGGITVGMYTFEHSTPEVIEAAIEQLGSYQALIAVTMIQTLVFSVVTIPLIVLLFQKNSIPVFKEK